jgi:hypothetical protein
MTLVLNGLPVDKMPEQRGGAPDKRKFGYLSVAFFSESICR